MNIEFKVRCRLESEDFTKSLRAMVCVFQRQSRLPSKGDLICLRAGKKRGGVYVKVVEIVHAIDMTMISIIDVDDNLQEASKCSLRYVGR